MKTKNTPLFIPKNHRAFTLVELIVVITILAILGTISFIQIQSFGGSARNSKRSTDLSSINQAISLKMINGINIKSFVNGTGASINNANTGVVSGSAAGLRISGIETYAALSGSYVAGNVNYTLLGLKPESFQDPKWTSESYRIGATDYNNQYEIAATNELDSGDLDILTTGTWNPRTGGSPSYSGTLGTNTFTLSGITLPETMLRIGDMVQFTAGATEDYRFKITSFSWQDTITVDRDVTLWYKGSTVWLYGVETKHLIKKCDSNWSIDTSKGPKYIPYPKC